MALKIKKTQSARGLYSGTPSTRTRRLVDNLEATVALDNSSVTLTWDAPGVSFNPSTSLYQIYKGGSFINTISPATTTTYVDTAVQSGQTYTYEVYLIYSP